MSLTPPLRIRQAAFLLALRRPWHEVTLEAIAEEAGLGLSELRKIAPSKAAILSSFSQVIDDSMLVSLARQPPEGEPHDRLFEVVLRRLEIMGPYREILASIVRRPASDPGDLPELVSAATRSADWMLAAAGVEADPHWRGAGKLALVQVYWRVLRVWTQDDDPGLAMTMAALDRQLRDAHARAQTFKVLAGIAASARRMAGAFWSRIMERPTPAGDP